MRVVISESKREKMTGYAEKALKSMGKLMQCFEELDEEEPGERDDEDYDDDDDMGYRRGDYSGGQYRDEMGYRRRRSRRTGRFIR